MRETFPASGSWVPLQTAHQTGCWEERGDAFGQTLMMSELHSASCWAHVSTQKASDWVGWDFVFILKMAPSGILLS